MQNDLSSPLFQFLSPENQEWVILRAIIYGFILGILILEEQEKVLGISRIFDDNLMKSLDKTSRSLLISFHYIHLRYFYDFIQNILI